MDSNKRNKFYYRDKHPHANLKFIISGFFSAITITYSIVSKGKYSNSAFLLIPIICFVVLCIAFFDSRIFDAVLHTYINGKTIIDTPGEKEKYLFLISVDAIDEQLEVTHEMYTSVEVGDEIYLKYSLFSKMVKEMAKYTQENGNA